MFVRVCGKLLLALLLLLVASGCDSGQPSGDALQSESAGPATRAPEDQRVFPTGEAVPTLTAISLLAANSTPMSVNDDVPSANLDACTLLTEKEAEAATGLTLKLADHIDQSTPGAKCRYEAEDTSVSIKVFAALDEAQAARVWGRKYNQFLHPQIATYSQYVAGVGDAAFLYIPRSDSSGFMTQRFWYMIVKHGTTYFELLWLTDNPDPTAAMTEMASKIVSRL
ncbi:MAG: hypothetical protein QOH93_2108 [Chloroflexia bacterium]|jgi:hypothetical protein|nr:hypothetical protein [Chloroflexia bacterium]